MTVPPAQYGYSLITTAVSVTLNWIYNYSGTGFVVTKILEVSCANGNVLTMPDATQVSVGEDVLIRNVGANAVVIHNAAGGTIASIPASVAQYLYVTDNTTSAGAWGQVTFGAGSAQVNAGALAGLGLVAISATLNAATPVTATAGPYVATVADRGSLIEFNAGASTLTLPSAATAGNNFLLYAKNAGVGDAAINPVGGDLIDTAASLSLHPNESAMIVSSGTGWFTVGLGRSVVYQFNQLVLDVSGGGTFTLTPTQASNKLLTFVGNPAANVTVVVPNVVAIYYLQSQLSTAHNVTVKTAAGTGVVVPQTQRTIAIDDGTNVSSALTVASTTNLTLISGSAAAPALNFAASTNSGLFLSGVSGVGVSANGTMVIDAQSTGVNFPVAASVAGVALLTAGSGEAPSRAGPGTCACGA